MLWGAACRGHCRSVMMYSGWPAASNAMMHALHYRLGCGLPLCVECMHVETGVVPCLCVMYLIHEARCNDVCVMRYTVSASAVDRTCISHPQTL